MPTSLAEHRPCPLMRGAFIGLCLLLGACVQRAGPRAVSAPEDSLRFMAEQCKGADTRPSLIPEGAVTLELDSSFDVLPSKEQADRWGHCMLSAHLYRMKEPSLLPAAPGVEVYRFLLLRAFRDPISLRIERRDDTISLAVRRQEALEEQRLGELIVDRTLPVSPAQWTQLLHLLEAARFWNPPAFSRESQRIYADASTWMLEGVRDGNYRAMKVISPEEEGPPGAYRAACVYLLSLSGLQLPADELF